MKEIDYTDIPMPQIRKEPREIAKSYAEALMDLRDTVKLASDIQNYADWLAEEQSKALNGVIASQQQTNNALVHKLLRIQELVESDEDGFMVFQKIREILTVPMGDKEGGA